MFGNLRNAFKTISLRICSFESRGLLAQLVLAADEIDSLPAIAENGGGIDLDQISRLVGVPKRVAGKLADELAKAGVLRTEKRGKKIVIFPAEKTGKKEGEKEGKKSEKEIAIKSSGTIQPPPTPPLENIYISNPRDSVSGGDMGGGSEKSEKNLLTRPRKPNIVEAWNEMAGRTGLPQVKKMTRPRTSAVNKIMRSPELIADWERVLEAIPKSQWLLGGGNRGWRANFDFAVSARGMARIIEGNYDDTSPQNSTGLVAATGQPAARQHDRQYLRAGSVNRALNRLQQARGPDAGSDAGCDIRDDRLSSISAIAR